jgi:peptide/nickel transport system ATP-binding protein
VETKPLLAFENYSIRFGDLTALTGLNLEVRQGEILGIIGESGSGKSVTFLSLLRLLPAHAKISGRVVFNSNSGEQDLTLLRRSEIRKLALRKIAYIFQDALAALNPVMKIKAQMEECIGTKMVFSEKHKLMNDWIEKLIPNQGERILNAYPHQLSGGQRQRVMIAMAMMANPQLIVADEPTTALDPLVQKAILDHLHQLVKDKHKTMVLISHDLKAIAQYCDRIAVFYQGALVELGITSELIANPKEAYTKALLNCKPTAKYRGFKLPTVKDFVDKKTFTPVPFPLQPASNELLIKGTAIDKTYSGNFQALNKVDVRLHKGECLCIIGESGSGKSTLARIIVELEKPDDRASIVKTEEAHKPGIQMVFQDPFASLNPAIRVDEAVEEVFQVYAPEMSKAERRKATEELLLEVGLDPSTCHKKPASFSGGQRQRIGIARALAANPSVLVCDEAVSALDISIQAQILNLLQKLRVNRNLSLIFITHDMNVTRYLADRVLVLQNGKLLEEGETEELFQNPHNAYAKELLSYYVE